MLPYAGLTAKCDAPLMQATCRWAACAGRTDRYRGRHGAPAVTDPMGNSGDSGRTRGRDLGATGIASRAGAPFGGPHDLILFAGDAPNPGRFHGTSFIRRRPRPVTPGRRLSYEKYVQPITVEESYGKQIG